MPLFKVEVKNFKGDGWSKSVIAPNGIIANTIEDAARIYYEQSVPRALGKGTVKGPVKFYQVWEIEDDPKPPYKDITIEY